jgi:lipopolysaccharide transport system ATP-binding protein
MATVVINVEELSKRFVISHERPERYVALRDVVAGSAKKIFSFPRRLKSDQPMIKEDFWALKEVSFDVHQGDRVGIIGRNGAGKSTLLKILSRITEPSAGRISIRGRVASLLEVGTGFHPELTGRENIYLNGAILGMSRAEIRKNFDAIVDFAEVEKFLDTPVKRYSSGMYVRLAFSVAAHLEPEILIVDEVLAVGDAQFQKKCLGKMEDVSVNHGRTVLFVSHNMASLKALCDKGVFLESGQVKYTGNIGNAINAYLRSGNSTLGNALYDFKVFDNMSLEELSLSKHAYEQNEKIQYSIKIRSQRSSVGNLCLLIFNEINERIAIVDLRHNAFVGKVIDGTLQVSGEISHLPLIAGRYKIGLFVSNNNESANFFDLITFEMLDATAVEFIKYPAEVRGYIEVNNTITALNIQ